MGLMVSSHAKRVARAVVPSPLYRLYRQRRIASLIGNYPTHDVTHEYAGHTLSVRLTDPLAAGWYDRDWGTPTGVAFLREQGILVPGARVFDIGAHQAIVALILAREVRDGGQVVAVEAEAHNARVAEQNRELNGAHNLTVIHAAGGAREGTFVRFSEGLNGRVDSDGGLVDVPVVTIDGLAERHGRPDLVMVDVEGSEGQVLSGATTMLQNGLTSFLIEVHDEQALRLQGTSAAAIAERLAAFDQYVNVDERGPFVPLDGSVPAGRFFLAAIPQARSA
jgi:FkbM family methyltransferase